MLLDNLCRFCFSIFAYFPLLNFHFREGLVARMALALVPEICKAFVGDPQLFRSIDTRVNHVYGPEQRSSAQSERLQFPFWRRQQPTAYANNGTPW